MSEDTPKLQLIRTFGLDLVEGDGRTIDARIVPYNKPTLVADSPQFGGDGIPYHESWLPSAFENQLKAANRVKIWLNVEHEQGFRGIVGRGMGLRSEDDGLHGTFRIHEDADGEKALNLVREGFLEGISLEAHPIKSVRKDGVVQRVRAHLDKVALCRKGAFEDAKVLAIRTAEILGVEPLPAFDSDLAEQLAGLGFTVPDRLRTTST